MENLRISTLSLLCAALLSFCWVSFSCTRNQVESDCSVSDECESFEYMQVIKSTSRPVDASSSLLRLPTFWGSHMVLQREPTSSRIWGWANPNSKVHVKLLQASTNRVLVNAIYLVGGNTAGNNDGVKWKLDLPPQPPGPDYQIEISDNVSDTTIVLEDLAFGDVFLCSGQSNMEMTVPLVFNATAEILDSDRYPHLRLATVAKTVADDPQDDVGSKIAPVVWSRSSPEAINYTSWRAFSATCYFFGRHLYQTLNPSLDETGEKKTIIPIGLVTSAWGGQKIETFSSPDALADSTCGGIFPSMDDLGDTLRGDVKRSLRTIKETTEAAISLTQDMNAYAEVGDVQPNSTQLWYGMIYPLLEMRFSGIVWYQGESNTGSPSSYACLFPAMISDWRQKLNLPDLPFVYVELAGLQRPSFPNFRAAQAEALRLPKVARATAIDLSDPTSPSRAVHSRRKQEVGRRVSLAMLSLKYPEHETASSWSGPIVDGVQITESPLSEIRISFTPGTADGLHFAGTAACTHCCDDIPFTVLNDDNDWVPINTTTIDHDTQILILSIRRQTRIWGFRYAWEAAPQCALYNGIGGADDHQGVAMAPLEWCVSYSKNGAWTGMGCETQKLKKT